MTIPQAMFFKILHLHGSLNMNICIYKKMNRLFVQKIENFKQKPQGSKEVSINLRENTNIEIKKLHNFQQNFKYLHKKKLLL